MISQACKEFDETDNNHIYMSSVLSKCKQDTCLAEIVTIDSKERLGTLPFDTEILQINAATGNQSPI